MNGIVLQVLNGCTLGALYILLASGLSLAFGLQGIVNVAHGAFFMLGAYVGVTLYADAGFAAAVAAAFISAGLAGLMLEVLCIRPLVRRKRDPIQVLVVTLGVAIMASEVTKLVWGPVPRLSEVPMALRGTWQVGALVYPKYWLFVMALTALFMGALWLLFNRTAMGAIVRSIALNREISEAMGTNAPLVSSGVFALGTGSAGMAGALAGPILSVYPTMCFDLLMPLFVVVILGGLGSLAGVVVSGLLLGLLNAFGVAYLSGTAGNIFAFAAMIAVLIVRPQGLFGRAA
jgi:branched-subunit amino acid ABC-type transport system permease component